MPDMGRPVRSQPARRIHLALVPSVALPLLLTIITGLALSFGPSDGLYRLHTGHFGVLDLTGFYTLVLGLSVLILLLSGLRMWWRGHDIR
jgi:hypothetical protein